MWEFFDQNSIKHIESGLFFEKSPKDSSWQIRHACWRKAILSLTTHSRHLRIRNIRRLELECSLWALYRSPPQLVVKKTQLVPALEN